MTCPRARYLLEQTMTKQSAAGTCVILSGNTELALLLLQRGPKGAEPFTWAFAGGRIEDGEGPLQAALRETWEELQIDLSQEQYSSYFVQPIPGELGLTFTTFIYQLPRFPTTWSPEINEESLAWGVFTKPALEHLTLHRGMPYALKQIGWRT